MGMVKFHFILFVYVSLTANNMFHFAPLPLPPPPPSYCDVVCGAVRLIPTFQRVGGTVFL
jgi:hypothetical protein